MKWITVKIEEGCIEALEAPKIAEVFQLCLSLARTLNTINGGISLGVSRVNGSVMIAFVLRGKVFAVLEYPTNNSSLEAQGSKVSIKNSNGTPVLNVGDRGRGVPDVLLNLCAEFAGRKMG
ncbi:MAG: hypothetical protein NTW60_01120 [Candidatus Wolfebacteria bacterium]|nr:hypothetical protein [Candidatus Wolfebacteria bacterium]